MASPCEKITLVHQGARCTFDRCTPRNQILLDADAVPMKGNKLPVATRRIKHTIRFLPRGPPDEGCSHRIRRVVRSSFFSSSTTHAFKLTNFSAPRHPGLVDAQLLRDRTVVNTRKFFYPPNRWVGPRVRTDPNFILRPSLIGEMASNVFGSAHPPCSPARLLI
jgi:hypothetical protein